MNSKQSRETKFMQRILRDQLDYHYEILDYWEKRCNWPNMDYVQQAIYNMNAPTHLREIKHLEGTLRNWS